MINKILDAFDFMRLKKDSVIFLELIPPRDNVKSSEEVTRLFNSIYGLTNQTSLKDKTSLV